MALGSIVQATSLPTNLRKVLRKTLLSVEDVATMTAQSWVRASSLAKVCPREEVLVSIRGLKRTRDISSDLRVILELGKAMHHQLQNSILPASGVLLGEWHCLRCKEVYGRRVEGAELKDYAVRRPSQCVKCDSTRIEYQEYSVMDEHFRLRGHVDGILSIPGMAGLGVLEAKSISERGSWEIESSPLLEHAIQAHVYMWLLDLKWAKILYWDKGAMGVAGFIDHTIDRDDDTVARIQEMLRELWAGLKSGVPPITRVCAHVEAPRAKECVVAGPCFTSLAEQIYA